MEPCSIRKLLNSTFKTYPIIRIKKLRCEEGNTVHSGKILKAESPSNTFDPDTDGNISFEHCCLLCGKLSSMSKLEEYVLDFNILLDYFQFETELHTASKYCSECYACLVVIKEKYSELVELRQELDSFVMCIKTVLRARSRNAVVDMNVPEPQAVSNATETLSANTLTSEQTEVESRSEEGNRTPIIMNSEPDLLAPEIPDAWISEQVDATKYTVENHELGDTPEHELMTALPLEVKIEEEDAPINCSIEDEVLSNHSTYVHLPQEAQSEVSQPHNLSITVTCPYCVQTLESMAKFEQHFTLNHPGHMLQCEKCDQVFDSIRKLRKHDNATHKEPKDPTGPGRRKYKRKKGQELPVCSRCKKRFHTGSQLRTHFRTVHEKKPVLAPGFSGDKKPFTCNKCRLAFTTKTSLLCHRRRAHTENSSRFICPLCGKGFHRKLIFDSHLHKEDGDVAYKCPDCPFEAQSWTTIYSHRLSHIHKTVTRAGHKLQPGPFFCQVCGRKFNKKVLFDQHIHNDQGISFKCSQCPFESRRWKTISQHEKRDHGNTENGRPYCSTCRKLFKMRAMFDNHFHTQTGIAYNCPRHYCPYQSKKWRAVQSHELLRHPAKETHTSPVAGQQESLSSDPSMNEPIAKKTKYNTCGQCGETFQTLSAKAFHVREAHGPSKPQTLSPAKSLQMCFLK